jgi:hypothetical protein
MGESLRQHDESCHIRIRRHVQSHAWRGGHIGNASSLLARLAAKIGELRASEVLSSFSDPSLLARLVAKIDELRARSLLIHFIHAPRLTARSTLLILDPKEPP